MLCDGKAKREQKLDKIESSKGLSVMYIIANVMILRKMELQDYLKEKSAKIVFVIETKRLEVIQCYK